MLRSGFIIVAQVMFGAIALCAADATSPVDYTQRNTGFVPAPGVQPERKTLPMAEVVQEKRVEKTTVEKKPATLGEKRATIELTETRAKPVQEKISTRPTAETVTRSAFDHRAAAITTAEDTKQPPKVAKYQEGLDAAQAVKVERASSLNSANAAKLNRFVFRKNGAEAASPIEGAPITPAAGGSAILK